MGLRLRCGVTHALHSVGSIPLMSLMMTSLDLFCTREDAFTKPFYCNIDDDDDSRAALEAWTVKPRSAYTRSAVAGSRVVGFHPGAEAVQHVQVVRVTTLDLPVDA